MGDIKNLPLHITYRYSKYQLSLFTLETNQIRMKIILRSNRFASIKTMLSILQLLNVTDMVFCLIRWYLFNKTNNNLTPYYVNIVKAQYLPRHATWNMDYYLVKPGSLAQCP